MISVAYNSALDALRVMLSHKPSVRETVHKAAGIVQEFDGENNLTVLEVQNITSILSRSMEEEMRDEAQQKRRVPPIEGKQARIGELISIDPLIVELGHRLVSTDHGCGVDDMHTRLLALRETFASRMGFFVDGMQVHENPQLHPDEYRIRLRGAPVARFTLEQNHVLVLNPTGLDWRIDGTDIREPAFGLEAKWVPEELRHVAERHGYTVVERGSVLATHANEILVANAHKLLTYRHVEEMLDALREKSPVTVEEAQREGMQVSCLCAVLKEMLEERAPIHDLEGIVERLTTEGAWGLPDAKRVEIAREESGHRICGHLLDEQGELRAVRLSIELERKLEQEARKSTPVLDPGRMEPDELHTIVRKTMEALRPLSQARSELVVVAPSPARRFFWILANQWRPYVPHLAPEDKTAPPISVIAYSEIPPGIRVHFVGEISLS